jgi:acetyl esterase
MAFRFPRSVERAVARSFLQLPSPVLRRIVGPARRSPDGLQLDLQLQALLWLIATLRVPSLVGGAVEEARRSLEHSAPTLDLPPEPGVAAYERTVQGAEGPLRARVYVPAGLRGPSRGLVYFHGGGWVVGSIDTHDLVCRALAGRARAVVVSVDYRLAPEHPFPAAPLDAVAATRWVLAHAASLGIDPERVAVGGDSAGGNLAAVVSRELRDDARRPAFQLLVYPGTDMTRSLPSHAMFVDGFFLGKAACDWYIDQYLPDPGRYRDPMASPLHATDVARVPPALVITAGFDPLRDEGRAYAEKMREAGVRVEHVCFEGQMHGVLMLGAALRDGARMVGLAADRLRAALPEKG